MCSYAPWGTKLCLNGHEWAKRQLEKRRIDYEALDNGFLSCADPKKLQEICDSLSPEDIDRVFRKWLNRLPLPLTAEDRSAGYDWNLSIWQMEVSLTQIFDRPLRGREFCEEIIRDNLDLGRPDRVQLSFDRAVTKKTPGEFRTRVIQDGVHPSLHITTRTSTSSSISRKAGAAAPKVRSATPTTLASTKACPICRTCKRSAARSIGACWKSNVSATTAA